MHGKNVKLYFNINNSTWLPQNANPQRSDITYALPKLSLLLPIPLILHAPKCFFVGLLSKKLGRKQHDLYTFFPTCIYWYKPSLLLYINFIILVLRDRLNINITDYFTAASPRT